MGAPFGFGTTFSYGSVTGTDFQYFAIRQYSVTSGVFEYVNFPGRTATLIGGGVTIYENNTPTIDLPTGQSVIIDFYTSAYLASLSITVDFIGPDEAFKIQHIFQPCFTFDDFQFKSEITNLEGFCGKLENFKVKLPPGATNTMGLPLNFSADITVPTNSGTIASDALDIPETACENTICLAYWSSACNCMVSDPCGCTDFNVEFYLKPCEGTTMICPTQVTITKPIKICCRCGTSGGDGGSPVDPTLGRQTTSTALTGDNSELTIFPNPNQSGKLQVSASGNPLQNIKIYTVDGKLVKNVTVKEGVSQVSVDISNLQPGIYQVKVLDNANTVSNKKLIVQ